MILMYFVQSVDGVLDTIDDWVDSKTIGRLKSARTNLEKASQEIIGRLTEVEQKELIKRAEHNKLTVEPKDKKDTSRYYEKQECIYTIAEKVQELVCYVCDDSKKVHSCELKDAMLALDVPVYYSKVKDDECPYKVR